MIIPNRKGLSDPPNIKQIENKLVDVKFSIVQKTVSKPQNIIVPEIAKDDRFIGEQNCYMRYILQKFGNVHQNTYSKKLKTDNLLSPRMRQVARTLNLRKRQIDGKTKDIQKIDLGILLKKDKLSCGSTATAVIEFKKKIQQFDEDTHNFIYPRPSLSNTNQSSSMNANLSGIAQEYNMCPPPPHYHHHSQKNMQKNKNHQLNMKRIFSQIGPITQMQTQQQMYHINNNDNLHLQKYKQSTQQTNSFTTLQQQLSNQEKYYKLQRDNIQLAPIQNRLQGNISKQQFNYCQDSLRILSLQTQDLILPTKYYLPSEEFQHQLSQEGEVLPSLFDSNEIFKPDDRDKNIVDSRKDSISKKSISLKIESQSNKIYKIRKHKIIGEADINALGKGFSLFFEQHLINKLQKDKQFTLKISAYRDFLQLINFSNKIYMNIPEERVNHPIYKAFVGKGNNQMLIRMVIKQRWWWIITDQKDDQNINLVWTQLKKNDVLLSIKNLRVDLVTSRIQRQTSLASQQQSPQNSSFYNQQFSLSPSSSQTSFCSVATPAQNQQISQVPNSNGCVIQAVSTQSLNGFQSESTTDESAIISTCNLIVAPKQEVIFNKNEKNLKKLVNQQDFTSLNKLFKNRYGKKYDTQAFISSKVLNNIAQDQDYRIIKEANSLKVHNHLQDNFHLSNKKALFYNMRSYYESNQQNVFDYLPLTFHIQEGKRDKEYIKFVNHFNTLKDLANNPALVTAKKEQNIWIVKPGEITNRGFGIKVLSDLESIEQIIDSNESHKAGMAKTYIIQKYIEYPLLYYKRKFDIRCYYLLTSTNGYLKGYWYQDGYIRTASKEFTTKNLGKMIHLTNDAVQKKDDQYGKYEKGNKVSYDELDKYIAQQNPEKDFYNSILPQMKEIGRDTMKAVYGKIDPEKKESTMEVFGLDFMIDDNLRVWLIEVNTNPALDICCPLLSKIIPSMIENTFRIAIDPLFPPPTFSNHKSFNFDNLLENNKYDLIFDEVEDSKLIKMIGKDTNLNWQMIEEEQEDDEEDIIPE